MDYCFSSADFSWLKVWHELPSWVRSSQRDDMRVGRRFIAGLWEPNKEYAGLSRTPLIVSRPPGDKSPVYYRSPFQGSGWPMWLSLALYCGVKATIHCVKKFPPCF